MERSSSLLVCVIVSTQSKKIACPDLKHIYDLTDHMRTNGELCER
jgi:hypothetical protein